MHAYATAMSQYAVFRGRASRGEFWGFFLVYLAIGLAVVILDQSLVPPNAPGSGLLTGLFSLVHILPGMAVLVRRLHDIDCRGWWVLINVTGIGFFVLLIMAAMKGTEGTNRFGPPTNADAQMPVGARTAPEAWAVAPTIGARVEPTAIPLAPTGASSPAPDARSSQSADVIGDLERLSQLRAAGGISDAEFEALKARTLNAGGSL